MLASDFPDRNLPNTRKARSVRSCELRLTLNREVSIHSLAHQIGDRLSRRRRKLAESFHLLFRKLYLGTDHLPLKPDTGREACATF